MKFAAVRLAVAAALFVGWVGYLGYLAATIRNPVVLSRPQFLVSERDVIATYKGGDKFDIDEILYPKDEAAKAPKTLIVGNLKVCQTFSPQGGWGAEQRPVEGEKYLLPLQTAAAPTPAGAESAAVMDVVPIPASPGYPPFSGDAGPSRIYPDTPEVRAQYQTIPKP